jgi:hypothetical protein
MYPKQAAVRARKRLWVEGRLPVVETGALLAGHILLALLMHRYSYVAGAHAFVTLCLALGVAFLASRPQQIAWVGAYITGAEVLWRMTDANLFWELGKFAVVGIFVIGVLRFRRWRHQSLSWLYFALLLPSALLTPTSLSLTQARQELSFNLSGPLALMVCVWFLSNMQFSAGQMHRLFLALLAPLAGVAAIAGFTTLTTPSIHFNLQSNFTTSGGFGPNQVSAVLGLGAFVAFFYLLQDRRNPPLRPLLFGAMMLFAVQSAMTFSRGGLYAAGGAALLASAFLARNARSRARLTLLGPIVFALAAFVILPRLDDFTGGALSARFQKTTLSNREELMQGDLEVWRRNPLLGVGPGMAKPVRGTAGGDAAAHTEFSRLVSEHGLLGLAALVPLLMIGWRSFRRAKSAEQRALVVSMMGWSFLFMLVYAMRLAAPAFIFGLACINLMPDRRGRAPARIIQSRTRLGTLAPVVRSAPATVYSSF